jgi:OPA family glycerol-3-phosphate transporter-like MFS transporter
MNGGNRRQTVFTLATASGLLCVLILPAIAEAAGGGGGGESPLVSWLKKSAPIGILLVVVTIVMMRLPKIDLGHSPAFLKRRVMNWLPLVLTYAFLYMGRYNLTVSKSAFQKIQDASGGAIMGNDDFGIIFLAGTAVYGISFVVNGPLTDRLGGKFAILVGAGGAAILNAVMGLATWSLLNDGPAATLVVEHFTIIFSILYAGNMYFQSFGAVAIVKVNAPWFHVRERGVFGAIFGILISLGIYFAFDWGKMIKDGLGLIWVFFVPALLLAVFWIIDVILVRDTPGQAGHDDFDTADASSGDDGPRLPVVQIFIKMMTNPIIITIACIEFCSGFLRQAIMQWYRTFAEQTNVDLGLSGSFVYDNWGLLLCCAGIMGGVVAGVISDRVFDARRGPVAGLLYGLMLIGAIVMVFTYQLGMVSWLVILMSMCVIGVHGMLSGTASMDFGGKKNVGVAVGIIDGFVYLGTATMSGVYAIMLPKEQVVEVSYGIFFKLKVIVGPATDPDNWRAWPVAMIPFALIGFVLALRVWNAKPKPVESTVDS